VFAELDALDAAGGLDYATDPQLERMIDATHRLDLNGDDADALDALAVVVAEIADRRRQGLVAPEKLRFSPEVVAANRAAAEKRAKRKAKRKPKPTPTPTRPTVAPVPDPTPSNVIDFVPRRRGQLTGREWISQRTRDSRSATHGLEDEQW